MLQIMSVYYTIHICDTFVELGLYLYKFKPDELPSVGST